MAEVKGASTIRTEQAARTRQRILEGAAQVFVARGFSGARIDDIAHSAGVAVPTVYKAFSNKRNLLVELVHQTMSGDADTPIEDQPWWTEQYDEPDPERQLQLIARNARQINTRAGPILEVLRAAAPLDTELARIWTDIADARLRRSRRTATSLSSKGDRHVSLGREDLAITLWSLTGPELFTAHVGAGRSAEQYERWLARVLTVAILGAATRA